MMKTRDTRQKKLILRLVADNYAHPTADAIYERARALDPHISRGTVYRNLNLLAEGGEIRRLTMPDGPDHYDCSTANHYHFFCRGCLRVFDTGLPYREELNATPPDMPGFQTERHRLLLIGLCPECAGHRD